MNFSEWLKANDYDEAQLSASQRKHLEAAWKAETAPPPEPKPDDRLRASTFDETMQAIEAEDQRVNYIREKTEVFCRQWIGNSDKIRQAKELCASAIGDQKTDARAYDLALLRLDRSAGGIVITPREQQMSAAVVEAAVCRKSGLGDIEKYFPGHVLEASEQHFKNGLSLVGLMHHSAQRNGWRGMPDPQSKSFLRAAFGANGDGSTIDLYAGTTGPSTYSLPNILGNIANKYLRAGYMGVDSAWMRLASKRSVNNFQTVTGTGLNGATMYRTLAPSGEIKHATLTETTYTNRAATYAIMIGITRESLINDDAGAFTDLSRHVGRGAALKINDLFWTAFLDNASFFSSGNANVSTGAGSALGSAEGAAINAAEVVFVNQTGADGYPIAVMPKIILAPPTLANTARRWMGSQGFTISGTAGGGDTNIYAGRYSIETSPYMESAAYTGNSTAAWYLLASPDDIPVIEGVALNGRWEPTVETAEADFNALGFAVRGFMDVGFSLYEFRGGVRSAGS